MRATAVLVAFLAVVAVPAAAGSAGGLATQDATAELVARYPADNGTMVERTVVAPEDVASVSPPAEGRNGWQVPLELEQAAAASLSDTLVEAGFTGEGVQSCPADGERNDDGYCLLTVVDGEVTSALGIAPGLADALESGSFEQNPRLQFVTSDEGTARTAARAFGWQPDAGTTTAQATESTAGMATENTAETTARTTELTPDGSESDASVPGFGVVAALVAAAVATGVAARE